MNQQISVIIVNYKTADLTVAAARSALADPLVSEVIIVDNSAPDNHDSAYPPKALAAAETSVRWLPMTGNPGFGQANNAGAKEASQSLLFFLNSDATLQPGALEPLVELLQDAQLGLVAPPIYMPNGTLQPDVCGPFPTPWQLITRQTRQECRSETPDWLSGVAFLARRDEFLEVGGFAAEIFMYYEDVELCWRYWHRLGRRMRRLSQGPGVVHLGGASHTSTRQQKAAYFQSQDYYLRAAGYAAPMRLMVKMIRWPYQWIGNWFLWKK